MRLLGRTKVPADVVERARLSRGERVLASAATGDGTWLVGTRDTLAIVGPDDSTRVPWEQVETADWDRDQERLRVAEVGEFGHQRPVHTFTVAEPRRLLQLVRERVMASVVLQRRVVVSGRLGVLVVARRAPRGVGEIIWACEYDAGLDPDDPSVRLVVDEAMSAAQDEVGSGPVTI